MSWMATIASDAISSRQASISSFSVNGSPTWTVGRFSSVSSEKSARPWSRRGCRRGRSSSRHRRPDCRCRRRPNRRSCPGLGDADGHRVDQDVAVIGAVEIDLAADGRHADAIAVAADAGDDAGDQVAHLGMVGPAEAQRVQIGDRPRAHREHVAQDAADAGRRALIGLDVGRVVVALHLEDRGLAVADVDHAGILARAADHPRRRRRQLLQMDARALVGAMLRPHHREDAELGQVRLAPHGVEDALIFLGREAVLGDDLGVMRFDMRRLYSIEYRLSKAAHGSSDDHPLFSHPGGPE